MTTRSTKGIPSTSTYPSDSNLPTPTKRKRPQHDNPGAVGWLGIAFQLPSVIKKEINDFVKTIRGGNASQSALRLSTNNLRDNQKVEPEDIQRHFQHRLTESVKEVDDHYAPRHPHSLYRSIHRRGLTPEYTGSSSRIRSPIFSDFHLPSPPKKMKRLNMPSPQTTSATGESIQQNPSNRTTTGLQQSSSHDFPEFNHLGRNPITSTPLSHVAQVNLAEAEMNCTDHLSATSNLPSKIQQSHEARDNNSEMEEIICNHPKKVEKRNMCQSSSHVVGYNSVLFPDSKNPRHLDSPGSSVNADVSSSTWQASSSFSINSGSNMHRGVSNHTSMTSNTSVELNPQEELRFKGHHTDRLNSISSQPSPRIRHTKILGSPRNHHTSGSSISSIGSVLTPDAISRYNSCSQLQGGPHHILNNGIKYSLSNLDPPSDNECEFLTSDSDINLESPAAILIGRRFSSRRPTLTCRRKVPLSEIIGRPLNPAPSSSSLQSHPDLLRESIQVNPSHSITSVTSSFTGHPAVEPPLSAHQLHSQSVAESSMKGHLSNKEELTSADTSVNLSALRNRLSSTMHIGLSSPPERFPNLMSQSVGSPRQNSQQAMIMEVDEGGEDNSYEFLDKAEAQSQSPTTPRRKRKSLLRRSDFITFRRQGFAAVQQSPSKLIDLPSNVLPARSKTNVINMLRLSRGHKRHQSSSQSNLSGTDLGEDDLQSPTKKIRILETEIARLRRELENEKTKSAKRPDMLKSCNQPNDSNDRPHVAFSSHSPLRMSSPVSSRLLTRHNRLFNSVKEPAAASDSPVMVKKPSDGALVGGSPFIVSRVFGQGPEVVGDRTPIQAEKWLHKRKMATVNQDGARLPAMTHDLFGAKSFKSTSTALVNDNGGTGRPNLTARSGWQRDFQLEADLISTPKSRTLKKLYRNSKGAAAIPPSQLRNMFGSSSSDSQGISAPNNRKGQHATSQSSEMTTFLNELKASGKSKLRKTPGSTKYYTSQQSDGPEASSRKQDHSQSSHVSDIHNANILNSVLQNFDGRKSGSTLSGRSETTAASTNTVDSHGVPNESLNISTSTTADRRKLFSCSERKHSSNDQLKLPSPSPTEQVKSPLSLKVYPSGTAARQNQVDSDYNHVQVVLGEAISTPRKTKQASHLSRSLVDPHLTPRMRPNDKEPVLTLEKDFSMDELIKQVKDMKDNEVVVNENFEAHLIPGNKPIENHELVHQMGFCSSAENSFEVSSSRQNLSNGSAPSSSPLKSTDNAPGTCHDMNRPRASPLLINLTEGRPKPSFSPVKNLKFVSRPASNRWSSSSTIRLVSILNNSSGGRSSLEKNGPIDPSVKPGTRPHERRVRILEDTTNLENLQSSAAQSLHRHSLPADLIARNLINSSQTENEKPNQSYDSETNAQQLPPSSGPDWVLVNSDSKRSSDGEPNLRRWSLRASAILSTHPKIV